MKEPQFSTYKNITAIDVVIIAHDENPEILQKTIRSIIQYVKSYRKIWVFSKKLFFDNNYNEDVICLPVDVINS
ncbi:MAG: hypothetical protein WDZ41_03610 [Candidatus Babeliales bacterium]